MLAQHARCSRVAAAISRSYILLAEEDLLQSYEGDLISALDRLNRVLFSAVPPERKSLWRIVMVEMLEQEPEQGQELQMIFGFVDDTAQLQLQRHQWKKRLHQMKMKITKRKRKHLKKIQLQALEHYSDNKKEAKKWNTSIRQCYCTQQEQKLTLKASRKS